MEDELERVAKIIDPSAFQELVFIRHDPERNKRQQLARSKAIAILTALRSPTDVDLREALKPFAREADRLNLREEQDRYSFANTGLSYGDLRRARAALSSGGK